MSFFTTLKENLLNVFDWNPSPQDDGNKGSNLFEDSKDMLFASILMYAFADLRKLAQHGLIKDSTKVLKLPMSARDIFLVFEENYQVLIKHYGQYDVDLYITSLENILKRNSNNQDFSSSLLYVFDDIHSNQELVYGIAVDKTKRRVTLGFRGSVTLSDLMKDAKVNQIDIHNPLRDFNNEQPDYLSVHYGFHEYLNATRGKGSLSKGDIILEQISAILLEHPGYSLFLTGHSLGGALCTLFGFQAAASSLVSSSVIPKPITCISVASPKVGNIHFRTAFQHLESQGLIRCLRIANYKDIVTLLPDRGAFSCAYLACCQHRVYRHVGVELTLYKHTSFELHLPDRNPGYCHLLRNDKRRQLSYGCYFFFCWPSLCCMENYLAYHGCQEYANRLLKSRDRLSCIYLEDLYTSRKHRRIIKPFL